MENKRKKIKANPLFLPKYTSKNNENVWGILENENGEKISYEEVIKEIIKPRKIFIKNNHNFEIEE